MFKKWLSISLALMGTFSNGLIIDTPLPANKISEILLQSSLKARAIEGVLIHPFWVLSHISKKNLKKVHFIDASGNVSEINVDDTIEFDTENRLPEYNHDWGFVLLHLQKPAFDVVPSTRAGFVPKRTELGKKDFLDLIFLSHVRQSGSYNAQIGTNVCNPIRDSSIPIEIDFDDNSGDRTIAECVMDPNNPLDTGSGVYYRGSATGEYKLLGLLSGARENYDPNDKHKHAVFAMETVIEENSNIITNALIADSLGTSTRAILLSTASGNPPPRPTASKPSISLDAAKSISLVSQSGTEHDTLVNPLRGVYCVKCPCLTIPLKKISEELEGAFILSIEEHKGELYLERSRLQTNKLRANDYNRYLTLKHEKGAIQFRAALESEKQAIREKRSLQWEVYEEYLSKYKYRNLNDALNHTAEPNIYLNEVERFSGDLDKINKLFKTSRHLSRRDINWREVLTNACSRRIDTPTTIYKTSGKHVVVFTKTTATPEAKQDDNRSIPCYKPSHRAIPRDTNINQLYLSNGKLYVGADYIESLLIYDADTLKYLGGIPLEGALKGFCAKNGFLYLRHVGNSKRDFHRISIVSENNWKKAVHVDMNVDFKEYFEEIDPKLIELQHKIYTFAGNELYIFPAYPNLKAVCELIKQEDYYLYFLNIKPSKEQCKTLKKLIDENQKVFETGLESQVLDKLIEERKPDAQQNNKSHELNLNELPEEILFNILNLLDAKDLSVASQASKKFYDLSNDSLLQLRYLKLALYAVHGKENDDKCIEYLIKLLKSKDKIATEIAKYIVNKPTPLREASSDKESPL